MKDLSRWGQINGTGLIIDASCPRRSRWNALPRAQSWSGSYALVPQGHRLRGLRANHREDTREPRDADLRVLPNVQSLAFRVVGASGTAIWAPSCRSSLSPTSVTGRRTGSGSDTGISIRGGTSRSRSNRTSIFCQIVRYVERNALRANLVDRAEHWRWSSLWRRECGKADDRRWLSKWPLPQPRTWLTFVNQPQTDAELEAIRKSGGEPRGHSIFHCMEGVVKQENAACCGVDGGSRGWRRVATALSHPSRARIALVGERRRKSSPHESTWSLESRRSVD